MRQQHEYRVRFRRDGHIVRAEVLDIPACRASGNTLAEVALALLRTLAEHLTAGGRRPSVQLVDIEPFDGELCHARVLVRQ